MSLLLLHHSEEGPHEGTHSQTHRGETVFLPTLSIPNCQEQRHTQTHADPHRGEAVRLFPVFLPYVTKDQPQEPPSHTLRWQWREQRVRLPDLRLPVQQAVGPHPPPPDPHSHLPLLPAVFPPQGPAHRAPPVSRQHAVARLLYSCLL